MNIYYVTLPIYYRQSKKDKSKRGKLVGMNAHERANRYALNNMKIDYYKWIKEQIDKRYRDNTEIECIEKFETFYNLYLANPASDPSNVIASIEKFFLDGMQKAGIIAGDDAKHHVGSVGWEVKIDKENPRIECFLRQIS